MSIQSPTSFSGVGGNVDIGATNAISVREWKIDVGGDEINVTSTGDGGWKTNIVAPIKGEGTFKINLDTTTSALSAIVPGTQYSNCKFRFGNTAHFISGTLNILKASVSNPSEEEASIEYSFVTTGAITYST